MASKDKIAKKIWGTVIAAGGTEQVAAALLGNAEQESSLNPACSGAAYGLFQFEKTTSEYTNFVAYCKKHKYKQDSADAQLLYLFKDGHNKDTGYAEYTFNNNPRNGRVGHYNFNGGAQYGYSPYISWVDYLKLKDIEKATKIWEWVYEAASKPMMENRIKYAKQWYKKLTGKSGDTVSSDITTGSDIEDSGGAINLQEAIAKLYTSDNYQWVTDSAIKETTLSKNVKNATVELAKRYLNNSDSDSNTLKDSFINTTLKQIALEIKQKEIDKLVNKERKLVKGNLASYPNLVEAPFIEVNMNGITIGGYNHQEDKFPNHINSLQIEKINGRINNYTINITHQIRAGEDPNFIDSLLSRTGVRNKIKIKYGDSAYGAFFKEEEAYIIDVTYSEDVNSARINYTIKAVSSVGSIQQAYFNFPGVESKPSTEIINLLYKNKYTSNTLLDVLPGMKNRTQVLSSGLIPTDDASLWIPGGDNMSLVERLHQLVSYMNDPTDSTSSYFLSYDDNAQNNGIFKITKVKKTSGSGDILKNCYYIDVGYPGNSFVTNFNLSNDVYWPMYFKYAGNFSEYNYDIDQSGNLTKMKINPLVIDDRYQSINTKQMNWWNFVSSYPISASVTIKGLMKPVVLMENVYIYAQFYGQKDMATGLYSIIGQTDSISGGGYTTTLQLLRVQN